MLMQIDFSAEKPVVYIPEQATLQRIDNLQQELAAICCQTKTTNSLLLQLLDQKKAVKPIKRDNVVHINGGLFEEGAS